MDIQLTADGEVVVFHDDDARRVTGLARKVAACEVDEVTAWRLFGPDGARTEERVPRFEEVLQALPDARLNVDFKTPGRALVERARALVLRHDAAHRVRFASFHQRSLLHLRRLGYHGPTGLGRAEVLALRALPESVAALLVRGSAAQIPVEQFGIRLDSQRFIERAHRLGLLVHYWVINDLSEARRLAMLGADGIVTDDPARLTAALRTDAP
jgi:glycerophosphoryl diester phosphodiesterase